jgi:hypothetical protein
MLWTRLTGGSASRAVARVQNPDINDDAYSIKYVCKACCLVAHMIAHRACTPSCHFVFADTSPRSLLSTHSPLHLSSMCHWTFTEMLVVLPQVKCRACQARCRFQADPLRGRACPCSGQEDFHPPHARSSHLEDVQERGQRTYSFNGCSQASLHISFDFALRLPPFFCMREAVHAHPSYLTELHWACQTRLLCMHGACGQHFQFQLSISL